MSNSPHGLQHARLPCPSLSPRVCSNSCPLSQWCHPTISSFVAPFLPSIFPSIRVFSNESTLCIRWPKYWSFSYSISPSSEYSGFISFRIDWLGKSILEYSLQGARINAEAPKHLINYHQILVISLPIFFLFLFLFLPCCKALEFPLIGKDPDAGKDWGQEEKRTIEEDRGRDG